MNNILNTVKSGLSKSCLSINWINQNTVSFYTLTIDKQNVNFLNQNFVILKHKFRYFIGDTIHF